MLKKKLLATGLATMMVMGSMAVMPMNVFAEENISTQQVAEETTFRLEMLMT